MTGAPFVSYAQNHEDVVLHRALRDVSSGRYIDVGANDPTVDSVTRAFYEAGWRGITVEPIHSYAEAHRTERPRDLVQEVALTDVGEGSITLFEVVGTGLSSIHQSISESHANAGRQVRPVTVPTRRLSDILDEAGWAEEPIHFMSVDVEGAEEQVLIGADLHRWRPWIIVVEALEPDTAQHSHQKWEYILTEAGYRFTLFDGLSRFYLAAEKWDELHDRLDAPANVLDHYELIRVVGYGGVISRLQGQVHQLTGESASLTVQRDAILTDRDEMLTRMEEIAVDRERIAVDRHRIATHLESVQAALSAAQAQLIPIGQQPEFVTLQSELASQHAVVDELRAQLASSRQELDAIRRTISWRVTRPIRAVRARLNRH